MKFSKVASITISLSWIFMIVVGSFFLLFAYNVISKYQSIQEDKYNIELKWALRETFNSVGRTSGIEETKLNSLGSLFENKRIEIFCEEGIPILSINGELDANNEFLQNYPTFMTLIDQEKKEDSYLAVESFRLPFKTTSMLALVSKKNLVVLDENSDISEAIIDKFEKSSYSQLTYITENLETLNEDRFIENIEDKNYNSVMFVSDKGIGFDFTFLEEIDNSYYIRFEFSGSKHGIIEYVDSQGESVFFEYIDLDDSYSMQTMAIFSSPQTFECSYDLILENTKSVYDFYKIKTQTLLNVSSSEWICSGSVGSISQQSIHYQLLFEDLVEIQNQLEEDKFNKPSDLLDLLENLEVNHNKLESLSCSYVY